jgi:hypothetical protein
MTQAAGKRFDDLAARLDAFLASPDAALAAAAPNVADELLAIGETILEIWLSAHGKTPTARTVEGFRLLRAHALERNRRHRLDVAGRAQQNQSRPGEAAERSSIGPTIQDAADRRHRLCL